MPVWNDKMVGHQAASRQVSVNSALTWCLVLCNGYQFCSSNKWVIQHHSVHALDMSIIIVFLYIWGCRSNKISLAQTAFHIPVLYIGGCMLRSDLTEWPPNQIWSVHWATTGQITLESHWLMLSTKHQPLMSQWQSSVNLHNLNTLEDHWSHKYTGVLREQHWLMLAASGVPVAIQC